VKASPLNPDKSNLRDEWSEFDNRIQAYDKELAYIASEDERARRLTSIPVIGVINATTLVAAVGDALAAAERGDILKPRFEKAKAYRFSGIMPPCRPSAVAIGHQVWQKNEPTRSEIVSSSERASYWFQGHK
jgi:hypothetical protein